MDTTKIFKELADYIMEELADAQKYIKKALCLKDAHPQLADMFVQLSAEELSHMNREHAELKKIAMAEPERYELAFELVDEHAMDWAKEIRVLHEMYRE